MATTESPLNSNLTKEESDTIYEKLIEEAKKGDIDSIKLLIELQQAELEENLRKQLFGV